MRLLSNRVDMTDTDVLSLLKAIFMVLFVGIVIVVGTLPLRLTTFKKNRFLRSMGTTFAGALFVNVALVHILPESSNSIQDYLRQKTGEQEVFPLANLLVMLGFLVTIFFTRIISTHSHDHLLESGSSHACEPEAGPNYLQDPHRTEKQAVGLNINQTLLRKDEEATPDSQQQPGPIAQQQAPERPPNHQDTYFLTLAMYFHTLFEGIAIGVQNSIAGFLSTAVAIAFHKWADALSMGIQYRSRGIKRRVAYGLIIGQAALNAVAIAFGWAITQFGDFTEAIFLSISAGTFLAISTMEMLGEELHRPSYRPQKFIVLLFATGFIAVVWFFENRVFSQ